jgi:hypothetical protein
MPRHAGAQHVLLVGRQGAAFEAALNRADDGCFAHFLARSAAA